MLYDTVHAGVTSSTLIYYEQEKCGSLAPKGVIALRNGNYAIRAPKRQRSDFPHTAFRLDVALSSEKRDAEPSAPERATRRRGSLESSGADAATAAAAGKAPGWKRRIKGRRRSLDGRVVATDTSGYHLQVTQSPVTPDVGC